MCTNIDTLVCTQWHICVCIDSVNLFGASPASCNSSACSLDEGNPCNTQPLVVQSS